VEDLLARKINKKQQMASPKRSNRVYVSMESHDVKDEGENTKTTLYLLNKVG